MQAMIDMQAAENEEYISDSGCKLAWAFHITKYATASSGNALNSIANVSPSTSFRQRQPLMVWKDFGQGIMGPWPRQGRPSILPRYLIIHVCSLRCQSIQLYPHWERLST
jgi:hypothetical protein